MKKIDLTGLINEEMQFTINVEKKQFTMEDVKEAFYRNTNNSVTLIQEDSVKALYRLLEEQEKFDFIYVDGSHLLLDVLMDVTLSWTLLKKNGILAIDDYLCFFNGNQPDISADYFLKKIDGNYDVISSGYRLFIRKIIFSKI
jgi:predicted O-methyltransferase YrrM